MDDNTKNNLNNENESGQTNESNPNSESDQNNQAEELKQGAKETFNQTKEAIKNMDVKAEAKATQNFLLNFVKNPIDVLTNEVNTGSTSLNLAIVLNAIWIIAAGIMQFRTFWNVRNNQWSNVGFLSVIQAALAPLIGVLVMSVILLVLNKGTKKSLTDIIKIVTITRIPRIIASVITILNILSNQAWRITAPISSFANAISLILLFFAIKALYNEESNSRMFKNFIIVYGLYVLARFVFSFFNFSI